VKFDGPTLGSRGSLTGDRKYVARIKFYANTNALDTFAASDQTIGSGKSQFVKTRGDKLNSKILANCHSPHHHVAIYANHALTQLK
jgi:hypothetical protein